jgi:N-methylhydantoinase B
MSAVLKPQSDAAHKPRVDAITLEVVRYSLVAMMDETDANLTRTAFSTIIREYKDYCVGLVTAKGETIAQGRGSIPTFVADLGSPVLDGIAMWGDDINEGDFIINNYAGVCGQHLNNVVMYTPIFNPANKKQIVAFSALRTHWPDVGGGYQRGNKTTEIYAEGIQFRNAKIYKDDKINIELERLIRFNTRKSDDTFGDLEAQVAGCRLAKMRFEELMNRYGWETVEAAIHECWDQSERYVRQKIRQIPNGTYKAESFMDNDGISDKVIPIRATVIVEDEDITVDFTEMPPQVEGPLNSGATGGAASAAKVAFKGAVAPMLLPNEGEFRPLKVVTKPGTIVSASEDAAMALWSTPIKTVIDVILKAFSQAIPNEIPAGNNAQYGRGQIRGRWPNSKFFWENGGNTLGGWGGHYGHDGQSALQTTTHGDCRRVPIEIEESEGPALVRRFELVPDSGGAGRWRGGLSTRMEVVAPMDANAFLTFDRAKFPPWGLFGGKDGMAGYGQIEVPGEAVKTVNKAYTPIPKGTLVRAVNNGGGGWGDPLERDLAAIANDLRQGYISRGAAEKDYGVAFAPDGSIDELGTRKRRQELKKAA